MKLVKQVFGNIMCSLFPANRTVDFKRVVLQKSHIICLFWVNEYGGILIIAIIHLLQYTAHPKWRITHDLSFNQTQYQYTYLWSVFRRMYVPEVWFNIDYKYPRICLFMQRGYKNLGIRIQLHSFLMVDRRCHVRLSYMLFLASCYVIMLERQPWGPSHWRKNDRISNLIKVQVFLFIFSVNLL